MLGQLVSVEQRRVEMCESEPQVLPSEVPLGCYGHRL